MLSGAATCGSTVPFETGCGRVIMTIRAPPLTIVMQLAVNPILSKLDNPDPDRSIDATLSVHNTK